MLSLPRLNFGASRVEKSNLQELDSISATQQNLQAAWMAATRRVIACADDAGAQFADEARKNQYGETPERGIRGKASRAETESLIEEGIVVMPLSFSDPFKRPLQ